MSKSRIKNELKEKPPAALGNLRKTRMTKKPAPA